MEWFSALETPSLPITERRFQEFHALHEIAQSLCSSHEPGQILQLGLERVTTLLNVESSAILLVDEGSNELYFQAANDCRPGIAQRLQCIRFPADRGIAGWVVQHGVSIAASDTTHDPRFYDGVDARTGVTTQSYLCVPLKIRGRVIGVLTAVNKRISSFSHSDVAFAEGVAHQFAVAIDTTRLLQQLELERAHRQEEYFSSREKEEGTRRFPALIGESPAMQEVCRLISRILDTTTTIFITGESGTGKEIVARAIHAHGPRAKGPFIAVNCAAIPESLLEAELFGCERGAFTGAVQRRLGRFELAAGGTLFLDEIGEMSPSLQAKLLRVLQEKTFERLGGMGTLTADTRIIAATNRDLQHAVREGKFRKDLFYRLHVYPIPLPPLRERRDDLELLAEHFLRKHGKELGKERCGLSKEVKSLFQAYPWPGNVRELEHIIERAVLLCQEPLITPQYLPASLREQARTLPTSKKTFACPSGALTLPELEQQYIRRALEQTSYNQVQASKLLGLTRTQLRTRMKNHQLEKALEVGVRQETCMKSTGDREARRHLALQ
jgi:Nif-specific regulatory protein